MATAKLASLVVDLQVQHAQLRKGLDEANAKLDSFAKQAKSLGKELAQAFRLDMLKDAGRQLTQLVLHGSELADGMGKLAQAAGAPVEEFSRLAYGADFAGVSSQALAVGMARLSRVMAEATAGGQEQRALFQALGVEIADASGKLRPTITVIREVAARFAQLEDGAAKTALAQDLLGETGAKLIPLFNGGADGLARMGAEADAFALTVSASAAAAAEELNDSLLRLRKVGDGLAMRVSAGVAPAIKGLADEAVSASGQFGVLDGAVTVLTNTIKFLLSAGVVAGAVFNHVGKTIAAVATAIMHVAEGEFVNAREALVGLGEDLLQNSEQMADRVAGIWGLVEQPAQAAAAAAKVGADAIIKEQDRLRRAAQDREREEKRAAAEREAALKREQEQLERLAQAREKAALAVAGARRGTEAEVAERRRAFERAGTNDGPDTRGFSSIDAALETLALAMNSEAAAREEAKLLELEGKTAAAAASLEWAETQRAAAAEAAAGAEALTRMKEASAEAERAMREQTRATLEGLAARAIGPAQSLVQAGMQGGAIGGPVGAAVGVGVELLLQSQQFQAITDYLGKTIQTLADAMGKLLEPLMPFFALLAPLHTVLAAVTEVLAGVLTPALELLFNALKPVVGAVLAVVKMLGSVWNALVGAVQGILRTLGRIEVFGAKPFGFLEDWAAGLERAKAPLDKIQAAMDALDSATFESAKAQVAGKEAQEELTKATTQATESMTNVPSGYKVALDRFTAAEGDPMRGGARSPSLPPASTAPGGASPAGPGAAPAGGEGVRVQVLIDGDEVLQRLEVRAQRESLRQTGRAVGLTPRLVGA